jgi:large subunit ribosomal protein L24
MHIKKGDNVIVRAGKDKGKKGKVIRILSTSRVLVEGMNMVKKHQKPRKSGEAGQILDVGRSIHISNVSPVDPKSGKATRVGSKVVGGKKVRIASKSGQEF